jgi:hypothetical protein
MPAATDHVLIQLTIDSVGLARLGFGKLGILSHNADFAERSRTYTSSAAGLVDFDADSPEGLAIGAAFAQTPKPRAVSVLRAIGTVTQRYDIAVEQVTVGATYGIDVAGEGVTTTEVRYTALADIDFLDAAVTAGTDIIVLTAHGMVTGAGPFRLSNSGGALPSGTGIAVDTNVFIIRVTDDSIKLATSKANALAGTAIDITSAAGGGTHTLRRGQNDVIIAQLVAGANAAVGANFTATQVTGAAETDTMRATATSTADWFSMAINSRRLLSIVQSHAAPTDVTLATDLAAILLEDSSWFCLYTLYNSEAYVKDAAAFCESNGRIYLADIHDSAPVTDALSGATDVGADLLALGYKNTLGAFYPSPAAMLGAREMGRWLPTDPGKATLKFKTLAGIAGLTDLTDTERVNLRARRMNTYEQVLADRAFFWEGTVFSTVNKFLDITRNSFWLEDEASKAILGVFVGNDIVPMSPEGITMLENGLRGAAELGEQQGVLLPGWTVEAPAFEDLETADIEDRNLVGLKLEGRFRSPIHKAIPVTVVLTF